MFLLLWKLYESGIRRDGSIKAILRAIITRVLLLYLLTVIICPDYFYRMPQANYNSHVKIFRKELTAFGLCASYVGSHIV